VLHGSRLQVRIERDPFQISVIDSDGSVIHRDVAGIGYQLDRNQRRWHYTEIDPKDRFFGFGETTGEFDKAQSVLTLNSKDAMGYDPQHTDGLYKHIPCYVRLSPTTKRAVGYFYHNTYECEFNLGREKSNYWHRYSKYRVDGGDIDVFVIAGPQVSDIVRRFADLTGRPAMLPRYALGYLGSSMYYPELPKDADRAIEGFVNTVAREQIPIDGFQLSSGYTHQADNLRYTFVWDTNRFPDPERFFENMAEAGVTVSPNVKPGMLTTHPDFADFVSEGVFVRQADGEDPAIGSWWGGPGAFFDFTNPHAREVWTQYLSTRMLDRGVDSLWNDNCEYDSLIDRDARCDREGSGGTIAELKPVMANLMCSITNDALLAKYPNRRPFVVCRAGGAGIQRFAQTWAGDNSTNWASLKYNIATILGMSVCGVSNEGADIGGFYGNAPSAELFVRWVQNGVFQPRFSIHSVNGDNTVTEPWMYPQYTDLIRDAINLRYALMPYLYSLMAAAHETGEPIWRPVFHRFQDDPRCYGDGVDFMVGPSLLVANVVEPGATTREVYLPGNGVFFELSSHECYAGGQQISVPVGLDDIPIFLPQGSIMVYNTVAETNLHPGHDTRTETGELGLLIAPGEDCSFTLYEDDGISQDYLEGSWRRTEISVSGTEQLNIDFRVSGDYPSGYDRMRIEVLAPQCSPIAVRCGGKVLPQFTYPSDFEDADAGWCYRLDRKSVLIKTESCNERVEISFEAWDMIGM
jgi:alpha-glucosidase